MPNIRETLAQQVREIEIPNDGYLVCSGEEGFRRGHYAGRAAAASLIASSPELAKLERTLANTPNALDLHNSSLGQHLLDLQENMRGEIAELQAENERLRLDAERYRWLREQHWNDGQLAVVVNPKESVKLGYDCPSRERLDAAIDDAAKGAGDAK